MPTILVADDHAELRESLSIILELQGYQVITAANGKEAVQKAWQHLPDLIVCDVLMPELDGFEVLGILRGDSETKHTPFIFLTGEELLEVGLATQFHFDRYFSKPFDVQKLLAIIHDLLTVKV